MRYYKERFPLSQIFLTYRSFYTLIINIIDNNFKQNDWIYLGNFNFCFLLLWCYYYKWMHIILYNRNNAYTYTIHINFAKMIHWKCIQQDGMRLIIHTRITISTCHINMDMDNQICLSASANPVNITLAWTTSQTEWVISANEDASVFIWRSRV